jgi:sulfur-oxidizing protein SoxY
MLSKFTSLILAVAISAAPALAADVQNPMIDGETWADLKGDVVGDAVILDGSALFELDAPYRAHDAATVPIHITQAPGSAARIVRLTLVVDENPAPVVAEFELGPAMGHLDFETRVRVNQYSNVRAIVETADGKLWMTGRYVKGAGGCSAPAMKDAEAALAATGKMQFKLFQMAGVEATPPLPSSGRREAQVMIRHPNYSGMQRDQVTQLFIPAYFVDEIDVFLGDERLFHMVGGISISEDPSFRFSYDGNGATEFRIMARDTDGGRFEKTFPVAADPAS